MTAGEVVALAVRVLSAHRNGTVADQHEVEILRQHASPSEVELNIGALACAVIRQETEHQLAGLRMVRKEVEAHAHAHRGKHP